MRAPNFQAGKYYYVSVHKDFRSGPPILGTCFLRGHFQSDPQCVVGKCHLMEFNLHCRIKSQKLTFAPIGHLPSAPTATAILKAMQYSFHSVGEAAERQSAPVWSKYFAKTSSVLPMASGT